mmetsp:Transcript_63287/g.184973  ORF Transcript_63287/g.184973 Transcript_63287/m.184973 type:complete len:241 (-) Transcript_63287:644-1366(-)
MTLYIGLVMQQRSYASSPSHAKTRSLMESGICGYAFIMESKQRCAQAGAASASTFRSSLPWGAQLLLPSCMPRARSERTQFFLPRSCMFTLRYFLSKRSRPTRLRPGVEPRTACRSLMLPTTNAALRTWPTSHLRPCRAARASSSAPALTASARPPASAAERRSSQAEARASEERLSALRCRSRLSSDDSAKATGSARHRGSSGDSSSSAGALGARGALAAPRRSSAEKRRSSSTETTPG